MKRFSEQFNKKAQSTRLSAGEKRELRERLVSYMEYHPLPAELKQATPSHFIVSGQEFILFNFNKWRALKWSSAVALLFVVSISYLAEKAVPGDALYAVKVGINEEVRGTLARSSYEKVVWETELLNRRISEAQLLADEGKLTKEVEEDVVLAVIEHSENARKEIENLKLSDKDEATLASISLNTALDIQSISLSHREETGVEGESTERIVAILSATQAAQPAVEETELPAYDRVLGKVESETTRAYELLKNIDDSATPEEKNDVTNRLGDIDTRIAAAMILVESDEIAARKDLVFVLEQIHKLISFMTNIDVRNNLTVDDLVPDVLTKEQRLAIVREQITSTESILAEVLDKVGTTTSSNIDSVEPEKIEKINLGITKTRDNLSQLTNLLTETEPNIENLESISTEAYSMISDVALLLEIRVSEEVVVPIETEITEPVLPEETSTSTDIQSEVEPETDSEPVTETEPSV